MKRILFTLLILGVFGLVYQYNTNTFQISDDMEFGKNYMKKIPVEPTRDSFMRYDSTTEKILKSVKDQDLLGLSCSDSFIRTEQGAYILENIRTKNIFTKRVKNQAFIEFMRGKERTLPRGSKILTARICEIENKDLILFYSIGMYDNNFNSPLPIKKVILYSSNNAAFFQIIPKGLLLPPAIFNIAQSRAHLRCDKPFQLTKNKILFILCNEEEDKSSNFYLYEVSLRSGSQKILRRCINNFTDKLKTACY